MQTPFFYYARRSPPGTAPFRFAAARVRLQRRGAPPAHRLLLACEIAAHHALHRRRARRGAREHALRAQQPARRESERGGAEARVCPGVDMGPEHVHVSVHVRAYV